MSWTRSWRPAGRRSPWAATSPRPAQCDAAAAALAAAYGHIDILVNNAAAFTAPGSSHTSASYRDWTVEEWDHIIDVNVRGMWFMLRAVAPYMEKQGYGKVVNVTSSTMWEAPPTLVPYISSKGGVIGLTRAMARELGPSGVRVNAIAPGSRSPRRTWTKGATSWSGPTPSAGASASTERSAVADDLAGPAFFLASPDSDWMTGQTLLVDGGLNFN